jgi:hypothetical protein
VTLDDSTGVAKMLVTGILTALNIKGSVSPDVIEALRLWASGEDAETAAKATGVGVEEIESFKNFVNSVPPSMKWILLGEFELCAQCNNHCSSAEKFCMWCGTQNPLFDESSHSLEMGDFAENVRKNCEKQHPHREEEAKDDPKRMTPFCLYCGERLY